MKKLLPQKKRIKDEHKKRHISETRKPKSKARTPMNLQRNHNLLKAQKSVAVYFKVVKTEETFSNQEQKLVETTNL